ncbi:MAG: class I SAM-dependent methyltransferase [Pseudomonadales bacterium]
MPLIIPQKFRRNSHMVKNAGYDESAKEIIELMAQRLGLSDFGNSHILDVGCGTRFSAYMINHGVPVKSYTGVDVNAEIIDFLQTEATPLDSRFRYTHWPVQNALYNPDGAPLALQDTLPVAEFFDVIWLFSVFTHLNPEDASNMLRILRKHITDNGKLIFTCRINNAVDGFVDRIPEQPLLRAVFSQSLMEKMIIENGWHIEHFYQNDPRDFIRNYYICSPAF